MYKSNAHGFLTSYPTARINFIQNCHKAKTTSIQSLVKEIIVVRAVRRIFYSQLDMRPDKQVRILISSEEFGILK